MRLSRRQQPMAAKRNAVAHRNGSWPMIGAITSVGFSERGDGPPAGGSPGAAQNMAATTATKPSTISRVTAQSPKPAPGAADEPRQEAVGERQRLAVAEHGHAEREALPGPELLGDPPDVAVVGQRVVGDEQRVATG